MEPDPVKPLPTLEYRSNRHRPDVDSGYVGATVLCAVVGVTFIWPAAAYLLTTAARDRNGLVDCCSVFVGLFGLMFAGVGIHGAVCIFSRRAD